MPEMVKLLRFANSWSSDRPLLEKALAGSPSGRKPGRAKSNSRLVRVSGFTVIHTAGEKGSSEIHLPWVSAGLSSIKHDVIY